MKKDIYHFISVTCTAHGPELCLIMLDKLKFIDRFSLSAYLKRESLFFQKATIRSFRLRGPCHKGQNVTKIRAKSPEINAKTRRSPLAHNNHID